MSPANAQPLKLEVGKAYRTRDGRKMVISRFDLSDTEYPFEEANGRWYSADGLMAGYEEDPEFGGHIIAEWDALAVDAEALAEPTIHLTNEASAKLLGISPELYSPEYTQLCQIRDAARLAYDLARQCVEAFEERVEQKQRGVA